MSFWPMDTGRVPRLPTSVVISVYIFRRAAPGHDFFALLLANLLRTGYSAWLNGRVSADLILRAKNAHNNFHVPVRDLTCMGCETACIGS